MGQRTIFGQPGIRSYGEILSEIFVDSVSITEATVEDTTHMAIFLITNLVLITPLLVVWASLPLLAVLPVVFVGYFVYAYRTKRLSAGLLSGFFVLSIFGANVPLLSGPGKAYFSIYIVDLLAVVLVSGLIYQNGLNWSSIHESKLKTVAVLGLLTFVCWSYASAIVGNGPSQFASVLFAMQQTRYLLVFVVTIFIVNQTSVFVCLYPLLLSITGNLFYAVAEALAGHTFGLTYLGDAGGRELFELAIGPLTLPTGLYAGGFVGGVRELIALTLLLLPFLVYWGVYGSRRVTTASALGILSVVFIIKIGETDAGWMASIIVLALTAAMWLWISVSERDFDLLAGVAVSVSSIVASMLLYQQRFYDFFAADSQEPATGTSNGTTGGNATGTPTGASGNATGGTGGSSGDGGMSVAEWVIELFSYVPLVEVDTLGVRLSQYAAAIELLLAYPFFGIGGYNFVLVAEEYGVPSAMGVHNTFFSHLAATGIIGVVSYSVSVLAVVYIVIKQMLQTRTRRRALWGCTLAGLMGFHAYSFWVVIYGWQTSNVGLWLLSGIAVGAFSVVSSEDEEQQTSESSVPYVS
ncbi:O-antigen ligase family protein [Haloarcula sp. S1CR25-12]|uniref:O-antigen ligase family protein n=1 Tax=Haloarcula saliterrae TaxID=2950534 RepID=A0ABU2FBW8_9EURY|nr:O-antigen ligase family protein [Haloarcula sp. S1CR25-12]MDS0259769.1 O-antigen ligase family protein [Haloarcula sp. S1CR25-12]